MQDYSTTLTATPVQVIPPARVNRNLMLLSAPGAPNVSGGSGDIAYSFTVSGAALVPGAPGTFLLQGGQTVQFGGGTGQSPGFAPPTAVWAVAIRGSAAPMTAVVNDYGA